MNVYTAAEKARQHMLEITSANTVQSTKIIGVTSSTILVFPDASTALNLNAGLGFIFRCIYRNGSVEVQPLD